MDDAFMTSTLEYLRTHKRDEILALAKKHGIHNVRVFGSVAREEDTPESDIDFLISLEDRSGLRDWFHFWTSLEDALEKKVDVVPEKKLHWYLKPAILAEATSLWLHTSFPTLFMFLNP